MNNQTIKITLLTEISEFRKMEPTQNNSAIMDQFRLIQELVDDLYSTTASEKNLFLKLSNVVQRFSSKDQTYFLNAASKDVSKKTAALRRLQEWAKRAGDLLQDS